MCWSEVPHLAQLCQSGLVQLPAPPLHGLYRKEHENVGNTKKNTNLATDSESSKKSQFAMQSATNPLDKGANKD
jgi:hypothetical protein